MVCTNSPASISFNYQETPSVAAVAAARGSKYVYVLSF